MGRVGQEAHRFFMRTSNPALSGVELFDLNGFVGPSASSPRRVVLSFAQWTCAPCKEEIAAFGRRRAELASSGAVVAVVVMDEEEEARRLMLGWLAEEVRLPFPVVDDTYQVLARKYGVRKLPHTVLIGPEGRIRKINNGYVEGKSFDELLADIRAVE